MSCLEEDLNHVFAHMSDLWEDLRNQRIFITGGTAFFGSWLLESFCHANDRLDLNAQAVVLSREPARFASKAPHLAHHRAIELYAGDIATFDFPAGDFSHVIHAAIDYCAPLELLHSAIAGAERTLQFAVAKGVRRYLFTSSGAVYGRQPSSLPLMPEDYPSGPDPTSLRSAYGEGKRVAEFLCAAYCERHGLHATIARGFAFVGPYLPLDQASAIGNFIRDAMIGKTIHIKGDGTPQRSYLYGADLAIWLWRILLRGKAAYPYNVGSEAAYTVKEIAQLVAQEVNPESKVEVAGSSGVTGVGERYVPSTQRAQTELGLQSWIEVREGIRRTAAWYAAAQKQA